MPETTLDDALALPGQPESVGQARRFVREKLEAADRPDWVEAATLVVSELVTNSVLHAHSDVRVSVRVNEDHVRIEVWDKSPRLPMQRSYGRTATTGRGLELVATVSFAHGVELLGAEGKVVWCCVDSTSALGAAEPEFELEEWADLLDETLDDAEPDLAAPEAADASMTVVLQGLPPTLWLAAREHHDALLRELALVQGGTEVEAAEELAEGLEAADLARRRIGDAVAAAIEIAHRIGTASRPLPEHHPGELPAVPSSVDLTLTLRPSEKELYARMQDVLDEGERLAREERLLARPGLPEIIAVRDWACEQIIAQLAGAPPTPWPGTEDERFAGVAATESTAGWVDVTVTQSLAGMVAVDDANRIVGVSSPLAELLGWEPADLIGRRVVAIVPPRYREAHVAGFSRHLSTGVARALDVPLRLPVLRADGTEVECDFLIHAERAATGRNVYVATITPVAD